MSYAKGGKWSGIIPLLESGSIRSRASDSTGRLTRGGGTGWKSLGDRALTRSHQGLRNMNNDHWMRGVRPNG